MNRYFKQWVGKDFIRQLYFDSKDKFHLIKLKFNDIEQTDFFYYSSSAAFEQVYNKIISAPNFEDVDKSAGNKAYSAGLILY